MDDQHIYTKDTKPDLVSRYGRAWVQNPEFDKRPDASAWLKAWIVQTEFAYPLCDHYLITCVHLRDIPGARPANITVAGATHGVSVVALQPHEDYPINGPLPYPFPNPFNFVDQWKADSDEEAVQKVETCVKEIINGFLSPDTDYIDEWENRFK